MAMHRSHDGFRSVSKDGGHDLMGGPMKKKMAHHAARGPLPMPNDNDVDENPMSAAPSGYQQP